MRHDTVLRCEFQRFLLFSYTRHDLNRPSDTRGWSQGGDDRLQMGAGCTPLDDAKAYNGREWNLIPSVRFGVDRDVLMVSRMEPSGAPRSTANLHTTVKLDASDIVGL